MLKTFIQSVATTLVPAAIVFALAGAAHAAPLTITLPAETAKLRPSTLVGYQMAMQKCATCHSADYVNYQPPGMSLKQWTAEMTKMQKLYGAPMTDDEARKIAAYLAVAYGGVSESEIPADLKVATATSAPAAAMTPTSSAAAMTVDASALLKANACLACHAIDQKIVGPAYHDVALKYHNDPAATSKLSASIQAGGAGKWGQVPMPAYPTLKPEELNALAEYILKQ